MPPAFVLCPSFHGATLLGLLLNNHSRITSLGDTLPLRAHPDYHCSCGTQIEHCEFWQTLARETRADLFGDELTLLPLVPRLVRDEDNNRRLNMIVAKRPAVVRGLFWKGLTRRASYRFVHAARALYSTACELQGSELFVDGCKLIDRAQAYATLSSVKPITVVHLVRDPRGFFCSCARHHGATFAAAEASGIWKQFHTQVSDDFSARNDVRYIRVRYEDVCTRPQEEMARLIDFLGVPPQDVVGAPKQPHHIIGNEMLAKFDGTITQDMRWKSLLSVDEQSSILRKSGPDAATFGYV